VTFAVLVLCTGGRGSDGEEEHREEEESQKLVFVNPYCVERRIIITSFKSSS
jgi:hypothetical protein